MFWAEKDFMPEKETIERARKDKRQGKSPSTQAGEFVREEFHHIREGKHSARSTKQAIAIGLSKARRAGVKLAPPARGKSSPKVRRQAERDYKKGQQPRRAVSQRRSRIMFSILRHEGHEAASPKAIARQVHAAAQRRMVSERSAAARTKGPAKMSAAGKKAKTRKG
jgi:hypothetical protein